MEVRKEICQRFIWRQHVIIVADNMWLYGGGMSSHINPNRPQSNKIQQGEVKKMR